MPVAVRHVARIAVHEMPVAARPVARAAVRENPVAWRKESRSDASADFDFIMDSSSLLSSLEDDEAVTRANTGNAVEDADANNTDASGHGHFLLRILATVTMVLRIEGVNDDTVNTKKPRRMRPLGNNLKLREALGIFFIVVSVLIFVLYERGVCIDSNLTRLEKVAHGGVPLLVTCVASCY
jgi:hypothetical protein